MMTELHVISNVGILILNGRPELRKDTNVLRSIDFLFYNDLAHVLITFFIEKKTYRLMPSIIVL
jgi:hypothetical protein